VHQRRREQERACGTERDAPDPVERALPRPPRGEERVARRSADCADVCKASEEACEDLPDGAQMKACADACRSCFASCRAMGARA